MEDTMMHKNHASLSAALTACVLMLTAASSWANDTPQPAPQAVPVVSVPAPATGAATAPIRLAWDRVGITASGIGV
jgi:hypothetical protein